MNTMAKEDKKVLELSIVALAGLTTAMIHRNATPEASDPLGTGEQSIKIAVQKIIELELWIKHACRFNG